MLQELVRDNMKKAQENKIKKLFSFDWVPTTKQAASAVTQTVSKVMLNGLSNADIAALFLARKVSEVVICKPCARRSDREAGL